MIPSVEIKIIYIGNALATEFPFSFKFSDTSDVKVAIYEISTEVTTILTKDYFVDTEKNVVIYPGYQSGQEPPISEQPEVLPATKKIIIYRETPLNQLVDLGTKYPMKVIEGMDDKNLMICQELKEQLDRSLKVDISSNEDPIAYMKRLISNYEETISSAAAAATSENNAAASASGAAISASESAESAAIAQEVAQQRTAYPLNTVQETINESTGYGIISGMGTTVSGMTATVAAGIAHMPSGLRYATAAATLTIPAADATNPRVDLIYLSSAGVVSYLTGIAAENPTMPSVPSVELAICSVFIAANATTGTITDLRLYKPNSSDTQIMNSKKFGLVGDGVADDTVALQALADAFSRSSSTVLEFEQGKTYKFTNVISFDLSNKKSVKFDFKGAKLLLGSSFRYYDTGLFSMNFSKSNHSICKIVNCKFDGSGNPPDFTSAAVNPNGGRGAIFVNGATNVVVDNCEFNNLFYSACVWTHYATNVRITNCTGVNVGGRSSDNTEDARGDALYFGYLGMADATPVPASVSVENCQFSSWPAITTADATYKNIQRSGRAGIVLEFSSNGCTKMVKVENTSFDNYQRAFHIEGMDKVELLISNSLFNNFGTAFLVNSASNLDALKVESTRFNRSIKVMGLYGFDTYMSVLSAGTETAANKNVSFNNCSFNFASGCECYMTNYAGGYNITYDTCHIETDVLKTFISYMNFRNCDIRANSFLLYRTVPKFYGCYIQSCKWADSNSRALITCNNMTDPAVGTDTDIVFQNCNCVDIGVYLPGTVKLFSSVFTFTSAVNFKDQASVTRSFLTMYGSSAIESVKDCHFINNSGAIRQLFDQNGWSQSIPCRVENNYFEGFMLTAMNLAGYKIRYSGNHFSLNGLAITKYIDFWGTQAILKGNVFAGLDSGEWANGTVISLGNIRINSSGTASIIS